MVQEMSNNVASVVGYYGMSNYGDDLFGEVIAENAAQLLPGREVRIVRGISPRRSRSRLGRRAAELYATDSTAGSMLRLGVGVVSLFRSKCMVLGGGSVLANLEGVRRIQNKLAPFSKTRFQALGVSIGPFENKASQEAVAAFIRSFDRIVVRDASSMEIGRSFALTGQLRMGGDLAALYRPKEDNPPSHHPEVRQVGVAVCPFPGFGEEEAELMARELVEALRSTEVAGKRDVVVVYSLNNHPVHGDDSLAMRMMLVFAENGIYATHVRHVDTGVDGVWASIAGLDAMIAVRLHAAITAYLNRVPFVLLEYQAKCTEFLSDIGQVESLQLPSRNRVLPTSADLIPVLASPVLPVFTREDYVERAKAAYFHA